MGVKVIPPPPPHFPPPQISLFSFDLSMKGKGTKSKGMKGKGGLLDWNLKALLRTVCLMAVDVF